MKLENVEEVYQLSPLQQGILFHTLYAPSSGLYFNQVLCSIHGDLDDPPHPVRLGRG
jgi:surfactin family lipopeptide synthetase C